MLEALLVHLFLLLLSLYWVVGGQGTQLASQGLEDSKSVALVPHQGLVQPGKGGEPGGEVVHLAPPGEHLCSCSRTSFQQCCTLSLTICKKVVSPKFTCVTAGVYSSAALVQFVGVAVLQFPGGGLTISPVSDCALVPAPECFIPPTTPLIKVTSTPVKRRREHPRKRPQRYFTDIDSNIKRERLFLVSAS